MEKLQERGISATVVNARFAAPLDKECICSLAQKHRLLVTLEENVASGGMGEHVAALLMEEQCRIKLLRIAVPDTFVEHGDVDTLYRVLGMDADTVTNRICEGL